LRSSPVPCLIPEMRRALLLAAAAAACAGPPTLPCERIDGPADAVCAVPGFAGRDFIVHVPASLDAAAPVVVLLHGGGGKKETAHALTCPAGDVASDGCLFAEADREAFVVVVPDGTESRVGGLRTWNAGGGRDGFRCTSGRACKEGVDDLAYFDALLAEVERIVDVDPARVFVTGLSNGAAMSHRLACDRADRFAAIAAVGGGAQSAAVPGCAPARPVPVLQIHGVDDPCWAFTGGAGACLQKDDEVYVSVDDTMTGWAARNGCDATPVETELPDVDPDDGTRVVDVTFVGCDADVELLRIAGGGHTWPSGQPYLSERTVGRVSRDIVANDRIWAFFAAHPRP
jgi:polyhydroxybutyrate depolymerase